MNRATLPLIALAAAWLTAAPLTALPVTFFAEDLNMAGDLTRIMPVNSIAAQNSFLAAVGASSTEDFETFPSMQFAPFPLTVGGDVTGMGATFLLELPTNAGRFNTSGEVYFESSPMAPYTLTFSTPIRSLGFFATDAGDEGGQLELMLTGPGGTVQLLVPHTVSIGQVNSGSALFFGFDDPAASYTSVQFLMSNQADVFGIDDLTVAAGPAAIPEPSSWILVSSSLLLWAYRKKIGAGK